MQVSRLGNPLINEVIIPLGQKDFWNRSEPEDDSQFDDALLDARARRTSRTSSTERLRSVTRAERSCRSTRRAAPISTRSCSRACMGLNFTGPTQSDLLRLNTAIKPGVNGACPGGTASAGAPDRLAVLDADLCGFPNGRRLADDVVDIELRAVAQGYGTFLNGASGCRTRARTTSSATAWTRTTCRSRARSRTSPHRTRATRSRRRPSPARRWEGTRPEPLPPRPRSKEQNVRRMRLIVGAGGGGSDRRRAPPRRRLPRELRAATAGAGRAAVPVAATAQLQSGFAAGAHGTMRRSAKLQAALQAIPTTSDALGLLGLAYQQRARETGDPAYYTKSEQALDARPAARAARPRRDERARLARALAPPLRRGARARPQGARDLADDGAQLRHHRRRARRARPLPTRPSRPSTRWRR